MTQHTWWQPVNRLLSNPSWVALLILFFGLSAILYFMSDWLMPAIISLVLAYLLEGVIHQLEKVGVRRHFAVYVVFLSFVTCVVYGFLAVMPVIIEQARTFILATPQYAEIAQDQLMRFVQRYPSLFSESDARALLSDMSSDITKFSRDLLSNRLISSLLALVTILVYAILVPLLIFFFLKDKKLILTWLGNTFFPNSRQVIQEIWTEVDIQIGNYIRGKFIEIVVVWIGCLLPFYFLQLQYWLLLSFMVGLSVLIPYIGATVVTIPVVIVAYAQFGLGSDFYWVIIWYFIIQALDGNILVPLIFSEAVNIHPVAIILAVLVFGGLWGFWGIFFAIPLATLVKAIMQTWHRYEREPFVPA